jgi:Acyl-CoA carboxylase epsilon subunit
VSDGSETNNPAPVSRASGTNEVRDGSETNDLTPVSEGAVNEPIIEVLKGNPSEDEVAALVAVLGSLGSGAAEPAQLERTTWGLPVDKLRYAPFSWQKITLVQRVHMRR